MATSGSAAVASKPTGSHTPQAAPPVQVQPSATNAAAGNDPQRRGGGGAGPTGGAGAPARNIPSAPRNNQARRGHRNHRRPDMSRDFEQQIAMTSTPNGRKGTSITHLINWEAAAPRMSSYRDFRPRNPRRGPAYGLGSGYHAVDKARYINSNYRFIVNSHGDYRAQAVDSDVHLPWENVLQILASARTQCPNCPICLSTPVAPRMSKCGHIFCLSCLVRYMESGGEDRPHDRRPRYKKCVICTDSVYMKDIKPVRFFTGQENEPPRGGSDVVLRLLKRNQGSTLALPKDGADQPSELDVIPWYFAAEVMDYARIMKGTEDYMMKEFEREIGELKMMEQEDGLIFGDAGEWTRKAVGMIRTQMEGLKGLGNPDIPIEDTTKAKEKSKEEPRLPIEFNDSDAPDMYHIQHEARSGRSSAAHTPSREPSISAARDPPLSVQPPTHPRSSTTSHPRLSSSESRGTPYFFYQALPHYYLSPLDIRILKVAFGSFSLFPSTILPRVENVTTGHTVDDDLRRRAKYLAHLPYGCEVGFLECDWTDIVPSETLEHFAHELERRRKTKRDKEMKEERDRIRAERLEDEQRWAAIKSRRQEPGLVEDRFSADDFVPLTPLQQQQLDGSEAFGTSVGSSALGSELAALSLASPGTSPARSRTVWGTPALPASDPDYYHQEEDNSGWKNDWEQELMEEELMAQIEMEGGYDDDFGRAGKGGAMVGVKQTPGKAPSHGKGLKKGKKKKVTLMTNGGKRGA